MSMIDEQDCLSGYDFSEDIIIPVTEETRNRLKGAVFPDEYTINKDWITKVKTQYALNCWAFAATAMMETYLIKNNFVSKDNVDEHTFSETHMTYAAFDIRGSSTKAVNPDGKTPLKRDKIENYGGNRIDVASYVARKLNSVLEIEDPNYLTKKLSPLKMRKNNITLKKYSRFDVQDLYFIEDPVVPRDENYINTIKQCLMTHGVVLLGFFYLPKYRKVITDDSKYGSTMSYYMNRKPEEADKQNGGFGHSVAIVGWDDNFDIFEKNSSNKGAFKVKNSSGTGGDYGDGYIWISYDDANLKGACCITNMKKTEPKIPRAVYTHSAFGMQRCYPEKPGQAQSVFSDTFKSVDEKESIIAVGLCNITPCLATVELLMGSSTVKLMNKKYLSYPGFHCIEVTEQPLGAKGEEFTIKVTYDAVGMSGTYIPMEYKYDFGYDNLDLSKVSGSIKIKGSMVKITDFNEEKKEKYGNLPIYISVKSESRKAKDILLEYDNLALPELTSDGLLNRLPPRETPSLASSAVPIDWRLEPYERKSYDSSYKPAIKTYQMDYDFGMINTSASPCMANITAIIGLGKYALKKKFQITLPAKKPSYSFNMSSVKNGYIVDLDGILSGVADANIKIECNNESRSVKTDENGNWSISSFCLFNPKKDGGWKDSYANSTVTVTIFDDTNFELMKGQKDVKLKKPFKVDDENKTIVIDIDMKKCAQLALLCGIAFALCYGYSRFENEDIPYFPLGELPDIGTAEEAVFGEADALEVDLGGATVETPLPLFKSAGNVEGVNVTINKDFTAIESDVPDRFAGLALKMAKGSTIKNCTVDGNIKGVKSAGGLFFEGEDVTIENCTVKLSASCTGDYGGVAHTLTGASSLKNVTVDIKNVSGANVAGVAVDLAGAVSSSRIALSASATGSIGGVCCNANNAVISDVLADNNSAIINSSESSCVAGISATMTGNSSIEHCLVTGKINSGESGTAYGIAPGLSGNAQAVTQCVCVPSFITGKKVYRISLEASTACIAYDSIVNSAGNSFVSSGEILKGASELLSKDIFVSSGFDMDNIWGFDDKKCIPLLKSLDAVLYSYPFPCPYPTISGKYQFAPNAELALYGAANQDAKEITWRNLSPKEALNAEGNPNFMLDADEFYLQMHLMATEEGEYTMDVIAVLDEHNFSNNITIEIVSDK